MLETGSLRVWVAEDINQEQESAIKKRQLPGIYLQNEQVRFYPNATYAAHLIGYVDDNIGLAGIEFFYDRLLASKAVDGQETGSHLNQSQALQRSQMSPWQKPGYQEARQREYPPHSQT